MTKLLSIVIPVYKVEPYINRCLDSCILKDEKLMSQLEVIIVNDGTPDRSAEMSHEYVKRYPKTFRQIDKENGGHGSAWNVGLKEATGKYLRFLDSDDWLMNLDKLMEGLQKTDADIVFTHMYRYHAGTDTYELEKIDDAKDTCKMLYDFNFAANPYMYLLTIGHTTYRTSILKYNMDLFPERTMYDDGILFVLPAIKGKTYILFDFVLYNYFIGREGQSLGQEKKVNNIRARYKQCVYMYEFWEHHKEGVSPKIDNEMHSIIARFANYIFGDFPLLSYSECELYSKQCASYIESMPLQSRGKVYGRYKKYPFIIYYLLEQIRNSKFYHRILKR